jgi:hypothetical protein
MLLLLPRKIDDLLRWQVDLALANNLKIIPVRLDADSAVIKKVAGLAPLDLSSEDETQLGRITEAIS